MKKILSYILMAVMLISCFSGCGKEISADTYVTAMYKLIVNGDSQAAKDIGVSTTEVNEFKSHRDSAVKQGIDEISEKFASQCNATVEDKLISDYFDAYFVALSKLTSTVTIVEKSNDEAKVKITSTYIDMEAFTNEALEEAKNKVKAADYSVDTDYKKAVLTEYIIALTNKMKNFTPGSDTQSATVSCKRVKKTWSCTDETVFSQAITSLTIKNAGQ